VAVAVAKLDLAVVLAVLVEAVLEGLTLILEVLAL
jgi:hypothetical protein